MSRVENIARFAQRKEEEQISKEKAKKERIEEYKIQIRELKPRIDELLAVGNACREHGIRLESHRWASGESYKTHQFISNGWSHLLGFIRNGSVYNNNPFKAVGIIGGGACDYNLVTDGEVVEVTGDAVYVLKRFLKEFDAFERAFYSYVDSITEEQKGE